jgi:hypothetical protein
MIHSVLFSIVNSLHEFIKYELNLQEDTVILTNPVDLKGNTNSEIDNKLCVFLLHLEEEKTIKNSSLQSSGGNNPPIHFNLKVMFIANFPDPNYLEALRYISLVVEYFQGNRVFDKSNTPMLSSNVEKVSMEYMDLNLQDLNNVWSLIGLKLMPSVVYKLKLLSFTDSLFKEDSTAIIGKTTGQTKFSSEKLNEAANNALNPLN